MEEQSIGSQQILEAINKLNEMTRRVRNSSDEMLEGSKEIISQGSNLEKATNEIAGEMNDVAYRANEVNSSVIHVSNISRRNRDNIDMLKEAISHFILVDKHYNWNDSYLMGVENIDKQHMQLFITVNNLIDAIENGAGKAELEKSLDFLVNYTVTHFNDEEEVMRKYNFPEIEGHHAIHEKFKKAALELAAEALKIGSSELLVREVKRKIGDWLVTHVEGQDARVGAHIKSLRQAKHKTSPAA
jgi:hemerythrin